MPPYRAMTGKFDMNFPKKRLFAWTTRRACTVFAIGSLVSILLSGGCEHKPVGRSDRAMVTGSVTYKGKTVGGGSVVFTSAKDATAMASCIIKTDGTYLVADAP